MSIILPRCVFCENVPVKGIKGGYLLKKHFICSACEQMLLKVQVGSPAYETFVVGIKKLSLCNMR